ncbi:hypothetical protein BDZ91DRAFT_843996 [Kalaharituber pfeilii]|nr:hypothetical protein BDZ91DRAFT_843996 [Kalaharituber pfeilii]
MSIEALASYVLEEVALDGDHGTTIPKLFEYAANFYHQRRQRRFHIERLCDTGPAVLSNSDIQANGDLSDDDSSFFPTQALSVDLRKEIWKRLVNDKDFKVGKNNEGKDLELEEVEAGYSQDDTQKSNCKRKGKKTANKGNTGEAIADFEDADRNEEQEMGEEIFDAEKRVSQPGKAIKWKVYTSLEQRWRALTGHGIDHKKIPPKFFDLLMEIGRHREAGILQPSLTKITGQDARSVGPRTAQLAKMGYIEKVNVLAAKLRTSKLTLQSYATRRDLKENHLRKKAAEKGSKSEKNTANAPWTGDTVDVRKMVEAIFAELRKAKNHVLMHSDLKRKLGMDKSRFHFRAFARIIRRVEKTGCLRRIRVPLQLDRHKKRKSAPAGFTDKCLARCIKLIREPTQFDWEQTLNVIMKRTSEDADDENGEGGDDVDDDGEKDGSKVDDAIDDDAVAKLENAEGELVEESPRTLPKWTADRSLENIIYDAVDAAGIDGISSMELHQVVAGRFYYRPLDQILRRLGENPMKSQPPHLLRLAVIRETDIEGRHTHYRYFSYRWHQKLVEAGLGKPVEVQKKNTSRNNKKDDQGDNSDGPKRVTVTTDDLGFSFVDKRRLLKSDGSATLKEAQVKLAAPESANVLRSKYEIKTTADGKSSVQWTNCKIMTRREDDDEVSYTPKRKGRALKGNTPARRGRPPKTRLAPVNDKDPQPPTKKLKLDENGEVIPPKPRGRPRKPDHELKNPRKTPKSLVPVTEKRDSNSLESVADTNTPAPPVEESNLSIQKENFESEKATNAVEAAAEDRSADTPGAVAETTVAEQEQASPPITLELPELIPETPAPKRRGRPPKIKMAMNTPVRETWSKKKTASTPEAQKIPEFFKTRSSAQKTLTQVDAEVTTSTPDVEAPTEPQQAEQSQLEVTQPIQDDTPHLNSRESINKGPIDVPAEIEKSDVEMTDAPPLKENTIQVSPVTIRSGPPSEASRNGQEKEYHQSGSESPQPQEMVRASKRIRQAELPRRPTRHSKRFSASVDAVAEEIKAVPVLPLDPPEEPSKTTPLPDTSSTTVFRSVTPQASTSLALTSSHSTPSKSPANTLSTPTRVLRARVYKNTPGTSKQPRSEPTMILEEADDTSKLSYGSAGGMLMIARQRVILELLEENGGVFPGGLEIKHAFESRYKRKNPKAGQPDRRLMVSLVSSLQRSGKINQIVINFVNSRGLRQTKRILADAKLPLDSPLILDMKNKIVAADGNLWFPEGTEIPKEAQKLASSVRGLPTQPGAIETVEFERMYMPARQVLKAQRAADARENRLSRIARAGEFPRFTDEQKELAAQRLESRRKQEVVNRRRREMDEVGEGWVAEGQSDNDEAIWWRNIIDRPDMLPFCEIEGFVPAPQPGSNITFRVPMDLPEPGKEQDFMRGLRDVLNWEKRQILGEGELNVYVGFNMVNHFGPMVHMKEPKAEFHQEQVLMSHIIYAPDFRKAKVGWILPRAGKRGGRGGNGGEVAPYATDGRLAPRIRRKRPMDPDKRKRSRRDKAMAELHHGIDLEDEGTLKEVPSRTIIIPRKRHAFDHEQDDVLLAAIVIVRTLFGGYDRRIDWNLVATAFPDVELSTLRARWPRVRDAHKTHLKKLQVDFEEVYLAAYERGEMPEVERGVATDFDLQWHCRWFKENVTVPDAKSVPDLPGTREGFETCYELRTEKPSWADEFHNIVLAVENRRNFLSSHAFEVPIRAQTRPPQRSSEEREIQEAPTQLDCIKSLIKANILTDISHYDARHAYKLLSSFPVDTVDSAFYTLTSNKTLAPKKDAEKLVPGRNFEFTERFHFSMRVPIGAKMYAQAISFLKLLEQELGSQPRSGEVEDVGTGRGEQEGDIKRMELSPFIPDGAVMALLNLLAHRRVRLDNSRYISNIHGLVTGYRTRSMEKAMIDFPISVSATPLFYTTTTDAAITIHLQPQSQPSPSSVLKSSPASTRPPILNSADWSKEPVKLWYDIMGNLVKGMWRKCVIAVLGTVVTRPGVTEGEVTRVLEPALERGEVRGILEWLREWGVVVSREGNGGGRECSGWFVREGFWVGVV